MRILLQADVQAGVYIYAVVGDAEMQMVACGDAGGAGQADLLSGTDDGAAADAETAQVHIHRLIAVLVVNDHIVTGRGAVGGGSDTGAGGVDRPACACVKIYPLMIGGSAGGWGFPVAEGTGDGGIAAWDKRRMFPLRRRYPKKMRALWALL